MKSFDDAVLGGRGQGPTMIAQDWLHLNAERGPSNFDQRHQVTIRPGTRRGWGSRRRALRSWKGAAFRVGR